MSDNEQGIGVAGQAAVTVPRPAGAGLSGSTLYVTAYGLYAVAAVISLLFVATAVRETKGKTLEEM